MNDQRGVWSQGRGARATRGERALAFAGVAAMLAGCSAPIDRGTSPVGPADAGPPDTTTPPYDAGTTPWPPPDAGEIPPDGCVDVVDVVLVLDISSTMMFVLDALERDIGSVVDAANALAPGAHFGLVAFADNHALDTSGPLEGGRVHTDAATLQAAFRNIRSVYTMNDRNPGDGPSGPRRQNPLCEENSLDALYAAAAEFPWRENASRVVILATDDTFLERPDNYGDADGDGRFDEDAEPREGDYPALSTVAEAVGAVRAIEARVFTFTRLTPPGPWDFLSMCGTGRRLPASEVTAGWSTPYQGQAPIPEQTDGRNYDLDAVRNGGLSLAESINEVVLESYCEDPLY